MIPVVSDNQNIKSKRFIPAFVNENKIGHVSKLMLNELPRKMSGQLL